MSKFKGFTEIYNFLKSSNQKKKYPVFNCAKNITAKITDNGLIKA